MRRRNFIALLGSAAAAWPLAARAQQPAMPVIGFLHSQSPETYAEMMRGFRQGLKDSGYIEGENLAIEYRWANNEMDRLPALATDLVRRRVAVIATGGGTVPALAAKAATTTIPIVFTAGYHPVGRGLVASLARLGGNLTGINIFVVELLAKRLELLGLQVRVLKADTNDEINAAFESMGRERPEALFVGVTPFFVARRVQLVQLAAFHRLPAAYPLRDFAEAGGLISYGSSLADAFRQVGVYTGRILKGAKPEDLPVVQSSKFELVVNRQTAKMLGLSIPATLLATADEVIE